ncbi:MAG TPA: hypothetical protein PLE16_04245 [Spirochaetota bacterium]|nr:hypothetical protein [Spirochaetota bacterium]
MYDPCRKTDSKGEAFECTPTLGIIEVFDCNPTLGKGFQRRQPYIVDMNYNKSFE